MAMPPLARFKVLDLSRVRAGPTAVRQLADWGAEVIKIEPPGGEYSRTAAGRLLSIKTAGGKEGLAVDDLADVTMLWNFKRCSSFFTSHETIPMKKKAAPRNRKVVPRTPKRSP